MERRAAVFLGLFYFVFFVAAGIYTPYLGLYTRGLGFSSLEIGFIAALTPLSKILFPPVWGAVADRTGSRKGLILLTTALSGLAFSLLFGAAAFPAVALATLAYAFFHAPILALCETLALEEATRGRFDYGRVRAWDSLGYLVTALVLGKILDWTSMRAFLIRLRRCERFTAVRRSGSPRAEAPRARRAAAGVLDQVLRPSVIGFLLACTLMELSHSAYNGFFSIYLVEAGYTRGTIGPLTALPVLWELGAMIWADVWLRRWGAERC